MDDSEIFVFVVSVVLAMMGAVGNATGFLDRLYFRGNPAPGIVRLGILLDGVDRLRHLALRGSQRDRKLRGVVPEPSSGGV